jgi:FkbM family methyltransferase
MGASSKYGIPHSTVTVDVATLDSFHLDEVGFIKADVEGHELPVLRGATETLRRWRPTILTEVEEHRSPGSLRGISDLLGTELRRLLV